MTILAKLYWLPNCSTCQKIKLYLESKGVVFTLVHDIKADSLPEATIVSLAEGVGSMEALFSKRAMKFRSLGLQQQILSSQELLTHMVAEYTFIKRPVVVFEATGTVLAGSSLKQYEQYFTSIA